MFGGIVVCLIFNYIVKVDAQCTFPSVFQNTVWRDNTRGDLTFTSTTFSGFSFTAFSQTITSWDCLDNSDDSKLVVRASNTLTYSAVTIYVYMCLQLTKISDVSYHYYQLHAIELNAASERMRFHSYNNLTTAAQICDTSATIPTLEFHVLVKKDSESDAAVTIPSKLLFIADYTYSDGTTTACDTSTDVWDMCTDNTKMTFNYTTCSQQIAYSAGGSFICVATMNMSAGYDCAVFYNQDASIVTATRQFTCICSDGSSASVAPNNCTADQTPTTLPTAADGITTNGHLLTIVSKSVECPIIIAGTSSESSTGLSTGVIVAIVICILLLIAIAVILFIFCFLKKSRSGKNEKPVQPVSTNGMTPHTETINETMKAAQPKREKSNLSKISRENSGLTNKSVVHRNMTMASIGLEEKSLKREKSTVSQVSQVNIKSVEEVKEEEKEPRLKLMGVNLSFLVCCPPKNEGEPAPAVVEPIATQPVKKPGPVKVVKKGEKASVKAKGKGSKKSKAVQPEKKDLTVTDVEDNEKPVSSPKSTPKSPRKQKSDIVGHEPPRMTSTPLPGAIESPRAVKEAPKPIMSKSPKMPKKRAEGLHDKEKTSASLVTNGNKTPAAVSVTGISPAIAEPESKASDWTFLMCCYGNRSPPPQPKPEAEDTSSQPVVKKKIATKGKGGAKGKASTKKAPAKKAPAKKAAAGGKGKKQDKVENDKKPDVNEKDESDKDKPTLDRAKSMPEKTKEKTALSMKDAEKVKVDVYIPDEKTTLQLKDTVTVVKGSVDKPIRERAKTSLGVTRPTSSASNPSQVDSPKKEKKSSKTEKKGKAKSGDKKKAKKKK